MTPWLLVATVLAATLPCPPAPGPLDAAAAEAYVAVAEEELARGQRATAQAAVCAALAADPAHARARELAQALAAPADDVLAPALALMRAGEWAQALDALGALPSRGPGASLLEGLCLVELGRLEQARGPLLAARADASQQAVADFFLGVVDLQQGKTSAAAARLDPLAHGGDERLRAVAADLQRAARSDGRFTAVASVAPGFDSNVDATPTGTQPPGSDGELAVGALLWARPLGRSGPFLRARGHHRALLRLTDFTASTLEGAGGWQLAGPRVRARAEYGYEVQWLAAADYRHSHLVQAVVDAQWGPLSLGAAWGGRFQRFVPADLGGFSGFQHSSLLQLGWQPARSLFLFGGWTLTQDLAQTVALAFVEHGPRLGLELRPVAPLRVQLFAAPAFRTWGAFDPALGLVRRDTRVDAQVLVTWALGDFLALVAAGTTQHTLSNVAALSFWRWTASLGVVATLGLP